MKLSIGDSEVIHDCLELILRGQAGIQQITAFRLPFMETPIIEHFEVIRNNERHDVVPQALLEEQKPPDTAISILKRMDGFKGIRTVIKTGTIKDSANKLDPPDQLVGLIAFYLLVLHLLAIQYGVKR